MAFTVQDDSGKISAANAYATVQAYRDYFGDIGTSLLGQTDEMIQQSIVQATRYLDTRYRYPGVKLTSTQTTQWPRDGVFEKESHTQEESEFILGGGRREIEGIPSALKSAVFEIAYRVNQGIGLYPDPDFDDAGALVNGKTVKIGPITETIQYVRPAGNRGPVLPSFPIVDHILTSAYLLPPMGNVNRGLIRG